MQTIKKIKKIEFALENCEEIDVPAKYIEAYYINDITKYITGIRQLGKAMGKLADDGLHYAAKSIIIHFLPDFAKNCKSDFTKLSEWQNICTISIYYLDGTSLMDIAVNWCCKPKNKAINPDYTNVYQKSKVHRDSSMELRIKK
jgi:hypothetical protein